MSPEGRCRCPRWDNHAWNWSGHSRVCSLEGKLQPEVWEGRAIYDDEIEDDENKEEGFKEITEADQSCHVEEEEFLALIDSL